MSIYNFKGNAEQFAKIIVVLIQNNIDPMITKADEKDNEFSFAIEVSFFDSNQQNTVTRQLNQAIGIKA